MPRGRQRVAAGVEHCVFCDYEAMAAACLTANGRRAVLQSLKAMIHPDFRDIAVEQIPNEYKAHFVRGLVSARFCRGFEGEACVFALAKTGGPARVEKRGASSCCFCDPAAIGAKVDLPGGLKDLAAALKKMSEAAQVKALAERIPEDVRARVTELLQPDRRRRLGAPPPLEEIQRRWAPLLAKRQSAKPPASAAAKKAYRERALSDRARGRRHAGRAKERAVRDAPVDNAPPAPPAKRSAKAVGLERWALHYSWAQCAGCGLMLPKDLTQKALLRDRPATARPSECFRCRGARDLPAPKPEDVPAPLQGLTEEAAQALSPFEIDVGVEQRAKYGLGYRVHSSMLRLRWKAEPIKAAIRALTDRDQRSKARAAYKFLRASAESAYGEFASEHKQFLADNPDADHTARRRRLAFLERPGLECALWPVLFWKKSLTFSQERASDPRRQKAETLEQALCPACLEMEDEAEEDNDLVRHSVKRLYNTLALSSLLGYTEHFEILQFVYDLHLWSDLGAKRSLGTGVPMRLMMAGSSFSPIYWRRVHNGLTDLVRQVGFPKFFFTLAPSEWTLPCHGFVLDSMSKLLRARLRLPVEEITHVLLQTAKGFLLGETGPRKDWTDHVFAVRDETGQELPHLHLLIFGDDDLIRSLNVCDFASASMPDDEDMAGYVRGSQLDHKQDSGRPVFAEETRYDERCRSWRLRHLPGDQALGLRGYLPDVMDALKCHQDLLVGEGRTGLLRQYVAKYLAKFSDSASQDWLNDEADAVSIAATVLHRYHPLEPEMVLQLFGAKLRQWHFTTVGGGKRDFIVPLPDASDLPERHPVRLYENAAWACGKINLLDFLRKTNADGQICAWLKKRHADQGRAGETLDAFARRWRPQGEKVVAAEMLSRLSDRHYGQRLVLFKPFKRLADLVDETQLSKVPQQLRYLTMALLNGELLDEKRIDEDLKQEGHSRAMAESVKGMIAANKGLIADYLAGRAAAPPPDVAGPPAAAPGGARVVHNSQQRHFKRLLEAAVARSLEGRGADEAAAEAAAAQARAEAKALACMGPPGTGKTTVCHEKIEELLAVDGKVLFALPTAQLASRMKERYGRREGLTIDTCHAAFGFNESLAGYLPVLAVYDLVVVDEVSQLSAQQGDHVLKLWDAADRLPALVFLGDKWQMAGYGDTRPWDSNLWKTDFHKSYRCQDAEFEKLLQKLRTAKPDAATLKSLQKRKAWTPPGKPTPEGVRRLLHAHPGTTIVSCTRVGAQEVNACALTALFGSRPPLVAGLPGDLESNAANYDGEGGLKVDEELLPLNVPIHKGMDVFLTKNVRKDVDFVNGMLAKVVSYNPATKGLRVKTRTGHLVEVWRWSDPERPSAPSFYPIRPGYCSTIQKLQGAELKHISVYLDARGVPGAAYTAI
ncbi:unnamed protein product, partial [Effrenium voratum]